MPNPTLTASPHTRLMHNSHHSSECPHQQEKRGAHSYVLKLPTVHTPPPTFGPQHAPLGCCCIILITLAPTCHRSSFLPCQFDSHAEVGCNPLLPPLDLPPPIPPPISPQPQLCFHAAQFCLLHSFCAPAHKSFASQQPICPSTQPPDFPPDCLPFAGTRPTKRSAQQEFWTFIPCPASHAFLSFRLNSSMHLHACMLILTNACTGHTPCLIWPLQSPLPASFAQPVG